MLRPFWIATACLLLCCATVATAVAEPAVGGEPVVLFDGKSLERWRGRSDLWSVQDGAIVGRTTAEDPIKTNTFLIWQGEASEDFELRVSYKIESGNSGIQYRSRVLDEANFVVGGYQADIEVSNKYTGINYEEKGRGILAQRGQRVRIAADGSKEVEAIGDPAEIAQVLRPDDWNDYRVVAQGNRLRHYINDRLTCEVIDEQSEHAVRGGVIALQLHVGPPMVVRFRDLSLHRAAD